LLHATPISVILSWLSFSAKIISMIAWQPGPPPTIATLRVLMPCMILPHYSDFNRISWGAQVCAYSTEFVQLLCCGVHIRYLQTQTHDTMPWIRVVFLR